MGGTELINEDNGWSYIRLPRSIDTYSQGERNILKFIQSPQTPVDFGSLDGLTAKRVFEVHRRFWEARLLPFV
jgi:hypothetical protein